MPLVNGPTLTPKKLAANRANARLSRGPITLEGLIRGERNDDKVVANVCAQYDEKVGHLEWLLQSLAYDQFVTGAKDLDQVDWLLLPHVVLASGTADPCCEANF